VAEVANDRSVAWGCAQALRAQGVGIATAPDVAQDTQMDEVFSMIAARWGRLDTLRSPAGSPRARGRLLGGRVRPGDGHLGAFVSADDPGGRTIDGDRRHLPHRIVPWCVTRLREPQRHGPGEGRARERGALRGEQVGGEGHPPAPQSPGPIGTRATSGIADCDAHPSDAVERALIGRGVTIEDAGALATFLALPESRNMTGGVHRVDPGVSITA
jgi:enoyl-[acyl-carrier protein] reductase I